MRIKATCIDKIPSVVISCVLSEILFCSEKNVVYGQGPIAWVPARGEDKNRTAACWKINDVIVMFN